MAYDSLRQCKSRRTYRDVRLFYLTLTGSLIINLFYACLVAKLQTQRPEKLPVVHLNEVVSMQFYLDK